MGDVDTVGASGTLRSAARPELRFQRRAAQQSARALVDFLAAAQDVGGEVTEIGEVAKLVVARAGAVASARAFIEACSGED